MQGHEGTGLTTFLIVCQRMFTSKSNEIIIIQMTLSSVTSNNIVVELAARILVFKNRKKSLQTVARGSASVAFLLPPGGLVILPFVNNYILSEVNRIIQIIVFRIISSQVRCNIPQGAE